jgi:hypothetical protein
MRTLLQSLESFLNIRTERHPSLGLLNLLELDLLL